MRVLGCYGNIVVPVQLKSTSTQQGTDRYQLGSNVVH